MPLLIDGYNLLHASGILGGGRGRGSLERSRDALLNVLAESLPDNELPRTTVVFDAHDPPWGLSRTANHRGLTIYFASRHTDADTMIEELIKAHSAPRTLVVVSSDHRVQRAAKRRRATAIDSDRWFAELMRARQAPASSGDDCKKPEGPFSPGEVDFWLEQFTRNAAKDAARSRKGRAADK
jgi:predicted RNA-binding protein with PIN domain